VAGFVKRPWAALSNLAFFGAGIAIFVHGRGSLLSKLFGVTALIIGTFSTIYDVTYTYGSQLLDLSGMLVFVSLLIFLNMRDLDVSAKKLLVGLTLSLGVSLSAIVAFGGYSGDIIFGLYVLAIIATEYILLKSGKHTHGKLWVIALILFIVGFMLWIPDNKQLLCFNIGLFNGRAMFHYFAATTMYLLYRFYELQLKERVQ